MPWHLQIEMDMLASGIAGTAYLANGLPTRHLLSKHNMEIV